MTKLAVYLAQKSVNKSDVARKTESSKVEIIELFLSLVPDCKLNNYI